MATLIAPLASGIVGADSGTAEFYRRGSTTPVNVYADPDATEPLAKTLTLDANGGFEVYATESVFVRVRGSDGVVVREFTVAHGDNAVDVESASFTGTLSTGSQGAGGAVDGRTVLDRWVSSGGALDWKIRRSSSSVDETLVDAFDSVLVTNQPMFNVRTYGAVGDGVTNDYQAFVNCYNAVVAFGGGIIFVPAGNYVLLSAFSITSQLVSLMGVGAGASIITSGLTSGVAITVNAGASTFSGIAIQDIQITNSVSGANVTPLQIVSTPGVLLRNVVVKNFGLAVDIRGSRTTLHACDVTIPNSATAGDYAVTFTSAAANSLILGGSFVQSRASNTAAVNIAAAATVVVGAKFDFSAGAGTTNCLIVSGAGCKVDCCDFAGGSAATAVPIQVTADVAFNESNNTFSGSATYLVLLPVTFTATTQVSLGSRIGRSKSVSGTAAGGWTPETGYEYNEMTVTAAGTLAIAGSAILLRTVQQGSKLYLRISNTSGGNVTPSLGGTAGGFVGPTQTAIANAKQRIFQFVWVGTPNAGQWVQQGPVPTDI